VDKTQDPAEWKLDSLAGKMVQYCPLLEGLTGQELQSQCGGNFEVRGGGVWCGVVCCLGWGHLGWLGLG